MCENRHSSDFQLQWKLDFRMNGLSFSLSCLPNLKNGTPLRKAVPIKKRVPVALWRLATGNLFRIVSKTFATGKLTAVTIAGEFCTEIFHN